jgi:hypothetical protein
MLETNQPLCETHMSDDETRDWIINPEKWRVFASRRRTLWIKAFAKWTEDGLISKNTTLPAAAAVFCTGRAPLLHINS